MPDASHVGRSYAAPPVSIERTAVAAFAAAIAGEGRGADDAGVPPTFAAVYCVRPVLEQLFSDQEVGVDLAGLIHAAQSFEWPHAVSVGDVITPTGTVAKVETKRGMTFLTMSLTARNQDDVVVCSGETLLLLRGTST